jgi:hypothetical protein
MPTRNPARHPRGRSLSQSTPTETPPKATNWATMRHRDLWASMPARDRSTAPLRRPPTDAVRSINLTHPDATRQAEVAPGSSAVNRRAHQHGDANLHQADDYIRTQQRGHGTAATLALEDHRAAASGARATPASRCRNESPAARGRRDWMSSAAGAPRPDTRALALGRERAGGTLLSALRESAARRDEMLVGAAKEVSGIAHHERSRVVVAVQQRRIGWGALLVSSIPITSEARCTCRARVHPPAGD